MVALTANKGEQFAAFDVAAFEVPGGRDELWRFTPLKRLRGLHDGTATATGAAEITVSAQAGVTVEHVGRGDERLGEGGIPADRVAAQAFSSFQTATIVTVGRGMHTQAPVEITVAGPGAGRTAYGHLQLRAGEAAEAVVVIDLRGSGTYADNVEFVLADAARLTVVWIADWAGDTVHVSAHHARLGRDAVLRHVAVTLGGELVRMSATVRYDGPGGDAEMLGLYFADAGQHLESRLLVDHSQPNCRSNVLYKGALHGDPESRGADARTVWVGDVLIRAEATGTDTFEVNRNLILTDGARADSVPNLELETGEIVGAGHASATGRFDDEHTGKILGDATGLQVEELLVVEAARGARVTRPDDLAGLELEVGNGVGACPIGEDEIAVDLVRVDADGLRADEDISDPDRVRPLPLKRALVQDGAAAVWRVVIDEHAVLKVLSGIGEVQAEQFGVAAGRRVRHLGADAHQIASERHMPEDDAGVTPESYGVGADVHGVAFPGLVRHDGRAGTVADAHLDRLGERRGAAMLDDDRAGTEGAELDHQVPGGRRALP